MSPLSRQGESPKIADLSHALGYWTATFRGVPVDRRYGSWRITPDGNHAFRDVLPRVAAELQEHVLRLEKEARRGQPAS